MNLGELVRGRLLAIIIIAIVAAGCFSLGFFVGKATVKNQSASDASQIEIKNAEGIPSVKEQMLIRPMVEESNAVSNAVTSKVEPAALPQKPVPTKHIEPLSQPTITERKPLKEETPKTPDIQKAKTGKESAPDAGGTFSVQIGAFKKKDDAEALKKKMTEKGYNVYIVPGPQFKVRVGKYTSRREAEVMALKLNKTEGLNAYVPAD